MSFDALSAIGVVLAYRYETGRATVSGSCFAFKQPNIVLTAAHCVPVPTGNDYYRVHFPRRADDSQAVDRIVRHPTADIALIECARAPDEVVAERHDDAFWGSVSNLTLGEEFMSYGYPIESAAPSGSEVVPRLFRGYYQRFFEFSSSGSYRYAAGEMSIATPEGLSGGPVFRPGAHMMMTAMVTGIHESYTIADSYEELDDAGRVRKYENRRVVSYGLGLLLYTVEDWISDVLA